MLARTVNRMSLNLGSCALLRKQVTLNGNNKCYFDKLELDIEYISSIILLNGLADYNNENYEFTTNDSTGDNSLRITIALDNMPSLDYALIFTNFKNHLIDYSGDPKPLILNGFKFFKVTMCDMIYVDWSNMNSYVDFSKLFKFDENTKISLDLRNLNTFIDFDHPCYKQFPEEIYYNENRCMCVLNVVKGNIPYENFIIKVLDLSKLNTTKIDLREGYQIQKNYDISFSREYIWTIQKYMLSPDTLAWKYRFIQVKKIRINAKYLESVDSMFTVIHSTDYRVQQQRLFFPQIVFQPSKWVLQEVTFINPNPRIKPKLTHEVMDYQVITTNSSGGQFSPPIIIGTTLPYTIKIEYT